MKGTHDREAGIDQGRELPAEHDEVAQLHLLEGARISSARLSLTSITRSPAGGARRRWLACPRPPSGPARSRPAGYVPCRCTLPLESPYLLTAVGLSATAEALPHKPLELVGVARTLLGLLARDEPRAHESHEGWHPWSASRTSRRSAWRSRSDGSSSRMRFLTPGVGTSISQATTSGVLAREERLGDYPLESVGELRLDLVLLVRREDVMTCLWSAARPGCGGSRTRGGWSPPRLRQARWSRGRASPRRVSRRGPAAGRA